jgi:hypothetical protein
LSGKASMQGHLDGEAVSAAVVKEYIPQISCWMDVTACVKGKEGKLGERRNE